MGKFLKRGLKYSFPNKHIPVAALSVSSLLYASESTTAHYFVWLFGSLLLTNYMIQPHLAHLPYLLNEDKICA